MKKTIIPLVSVLALVFVAGCLGPTEEGGVAGQGLVISDFYSTYSEVEGQDKSVTIYLEAENQGRSRIENVLSCLIASNFPGLTEDGLWYVDQDNDYICQYEDGLSAADLENDIPGGTTRASWHLDSPCLPETLTRTDTFTGRVYYDYTSSAHTSIWVYSENELTAATQRGEVIPSELTVQTTEGPISISIDTTQPVRGNEESFMLTVTFSNVGGGTVFEDLDDWDTKYVPSIDNNELNFFGATINLPNGLSSTNCDEELDDIELRMGQSIRKVCDIDIDEEIATKKSYPITIRAEYGYYVDSTLNILAKGKRGQTCF